MPPFIGEWCAIPLHRLPKQSTGCESTARLKTVLITIPVPDGQTGCGAHIRTPPAENDIPATKMREMPSGSGTKPLPDSVPAFCYKTARNAPDPPNDPPFHAAATRDRSMPKSDPPAKAGLRIAKDRDAEESDEVTAWGRISPI